MKKSFEKVALQMIKGLFRDELSHMIWITSDGERFSFYENIPDESDGMSKSMLRWLAGDSIDPPEDVTYETLEKAIEAATENIYERSKKEAEMD